MKSSLTDYNSSKINYYKHSWRERNFISLIHCCRLPM